MEGYLQGSVNAGENVRVLSGITYIESSAKFSVMLKTRLLVSRWQVKRFGVNSVGKVLVPKTSDNIHVHLVESSSAIINKFDLRGVSW